MMINQIHENRRMLAAFSSLRDDFGRTLCVRYFRYLPEKVRNHVLHPLTPCSGFLRKLSIFRGLILKTFRLTVDKRLSYVCDVEIQRVRCDKSSGTDAQRLGMFRLDEVVEGCHRMGGDLDNRVRIVRSTIEASR